MMRAHVSWTLICAVLLMSAAPAPARAADPDISIVGSSTVYPFMRRVAQVYGNRSGTRIALEPTGTETGFDYFCAGSADYLPDINNASFAITRQQLRSCQRNGVRDIVAILIGYDGIVVFTEPGSPLSNLSRDGFYRATAAEVASRSGFARNGAKLWSDIEPSLPGQPLRILGPAATSGTRAFIEQEINKHACEQRLGRETISLKDEQRCVAIRTDGPYVEVGEDDQFLINAVTQSANTIGLVGYGQFRMTGDRVKPVSIDGVAPTYANIENGKYPLSRPLFVYVKLSSLQRKPEILGLLQLLVSDDMIGPDGELAKMGLILPSASTTAQNRATLTAKTPIQCPSPFCLDGPAP